MRILFVLHSFPPEGKGGTEIYASQLLLELAREHEVLVFYRRKEPSLPEYEVTSGEWRGLRTISVNYNFKDYRDYRSTYQNPQIEAFFREVVREFRPDVTHFHHLTALSMGLPAAAREAGAKAVLLTVHDLWLPCAQGQMMRLDLKRCETAEPLTCAACQIKQLDAPRMSRFWPRILERFFIHTAFHKKARKFLDGMWRLHEGLLRRCGARAVRQMVERQNAVEAMLECVDQCLLPSQAIYRQALQNGFPEKKMILAPKGVSALPEIRKRSRDGVIRIGFLGTLIPSKGPQILIEAFKKIKHPAVELELYGPFFGYDGFSGFEAWIRREVKKDARIRLAGPYESFELPKILSRLDLLAVPSLWIENRPLVIEEALQAALPVAASDLESIREQVRHGENGLLFEAGNPEDLARVIGLFLQSPGAVRSPGLGGRGIKTLAQDAAFHASLYTRLLHPSPVSASRFA